MIYSQYEQMKNLLFRSNISLFPTKDNTFRRTMECEPQGWTIWADWKQKRFICNIQLNDLFQSRQLFILR